MNRFFRATGFGLACFISSLACAQMPVSTAITYQGRVEQSGQPANGPYDFEFRVFDAATGGTLLAPTIFLDDVNVSDGVFTVELDFGDTAFTGDQVFLDITIREGASILGFQQLLPRQTINSAPYAIHAQFVGMNAVGSDEIQDSSITSTDLANGAILSANIAMGAVNSNNIANGSITGLDIQANTIGSADVNSSMIQLRVSGSCPAGQSIRAISPTGAVTCEFDDGAGSGAAWTTSGNAGTSPGTDFLGTTDNQALEIHVNANRIMRLEPETSDGGPIINAGYSGNSIDASSAGAAVLSGGDPFDTGFESPNTIAGFSDYAVIAGGSGQSLTAARFGFIGGGEGNSVQSNYGVISGGRFNEIESDAENGFIGGGRFNLVSGSLAAVVAGSQNDATGNESTVLGGNLNQAGGEYSVAAGRRAVVRDATATGDADGDELTFVWSGSSNLFSSTGPSQFLVDAPGGVGLHRENPTHPLHVGNDTSNGNGAHVTAGGTWTNGSSRSFKTGFKPIDVDEILTRVLSLNISQWSYKDSAEGEHIGPVAEDFHAAFGVGHDEQYISTVDADGVALAAIQALAKQNAALQQQLAETQSKLDQILQLVQQRQN